MSIPVTTTHLNAEAVQWAGGNVDEIRAIAGDDFLVADSGQVVVRNAEGPWQLREGDWVVRVAGHPLMIHSADAYDLMWEPATRA